MPLIRLFLVVLSIACSGCVPWRFSEIAHVRGKVLDLETKKPVANARLYDKRFPEHTAITSSDGHFDFPAIHQWSFFLLLPAPDANHEWIPLHTFTVEASGYRTNQMDISRSGDLFGQIIYLTSDTAPEPAATVH